MSGSEKRKNLRAPLKTTMHMMMVDTNQTNIIQGQDMLKLRTGQIKNLSATGACILTSDLKGQWLEYLKNNFLQIVLRFNLPGDTQPISAAGQVSWVEKNADTQAQGLYMLGLKFVKIEPTDLEKINRFIEAPPE